MYDFFYLEVLLSLNHRTEGEVRVVMQKYVKNFANVQSLRLRITSSKAIAVVSYYFL